MTLRDLIKKCNYKQVFNCLYREYYKNERHEKISLADLAYYKAWDELSEKEPSHNPNSWEIYITQRDEKDEVVVHVSLYDGQEMCAVDFVSWGDLIDCEVRKMTPISDNLALAHILWEITFYGFTEKEVSKAKKRLVEEMRKDYE